MRRQRSGYLALGAVAVWTGALANDAQTALADMSEAERNATFARVIQESGTACVAVTKSFYQGIGPKSRVAMWSVRCSGSLGSDLVVLVYPDADGSTGITTCQAVEKITPCWVRLASSAVNRS